MFELAGEDKAGLLAEITQLLLEEGCDVRSAAVRASSHLCMLQCPVSARPVAGEPEA